MKVAGLAARVGASYGKSLVAHALGLSDAESTALTHEKNAARILETAVALRGPFMKFVQLMAMQGDALPEQYLDALSTVHDKAPPLPWRAIRPVLRAELGRDPEQVFAEFNPIPIAAASLGQVYRARLHDGTPVAVKVQYPGVQEAIETDLATTRRVLKTQKAVGAGVFGIPTLNYDDLLEDLTQRMREELDYVREARNVEIFRRVYRDCEWATVPRVFPEYSTGRVLTMELLDGTPMGSLLRGGDASFENRRIVARRLWWMLMFECWGVGVVHADPHPGNKLIGPAGEIRLLDYGCVKVLPRNWIEGGRDVIRAILSGDDDRLERACREMKLIGPGLDPQPMVEYQKFANLPLQIDGPFNPAEHDIRRGFQEKMINLMKHGYLGLPEHAVFILRTGIGFGAIMGMIGVALNHRVLAIHLLENHLEAADRTRAELEAARLI